MVSDWLAALKWLSSVTAIVVVSSIVAVVLYQLKREGKSLWLTRWYNEDSDTLWRKGQSKFKESKVESAFLLWHAWIQWKARNPVGRIDMYASGLMASFSVAVLGVGILDLCIYFIQLLIEILRTIQVLYG